MTELFKHYKDPESGEVYGYAADGSQDAFIKPNLVPINLDEAEILREQWSQKIFDALPYTEKRTAFYPNFLDYIDGVVKGDQAQIDAYILACQEVKARFPKP